MLLFIRLYLGRKPAFKMPGKDKLVYARHLVNSDKAVLLFLALSFF